MNLGIDFGTSFTKMAYWNNGNLVDLLGTGRIPSVAAYVPFMDRFLYGQAAVNFTAPETLSARFFKLHVKRKKDFSLGNFSLEQLLYDFFAYLHRDFVVPAGLRPDSLSLSVPNNFGLQARCMLLTAAQRAFAVEDVLLLPEPVAALVGYNSSHPGEVLNGDLLAIDVGGGTSDFSFLSTSADRQHMLLESQFQVGQDAFSGSEIDRMVLHNILSPAFQMQYGEKLPASILNEEFRSSDDQLLFYRWMQMAEEIKITLSSQEETRVNYADFLPGRNLAIHVTRDIFHAAVEPAFTRMKHYWKQAVDERARTLGLLKNGKWDLDTVLLLGGASQTRGLTKLIQELCPGVPVLHSSDPDYQVIRGLCLWPELAAQTGVNLKTVYPFRFYMEKKNDSENTLEEIPFDTANLELDFQGKYEICTLPVNSNCNLASESDQVLVRVFELAEEDQEVQVPRFMDQNLVLQIEADKSQTGAQISIYLNLARARLELDNNDLLKGDQNEEDDILLKARRKQKAAYDLLSAYRFLDEMLVEDYGQHLESMESQREARGEEDQETTLYKVMSLLQLYKGK
ncbi:MAG TPA: Hsp70 family protein [Syntrophomonadaceae bacterium]|nr:Hsp70 family protein [Syntrophomonadaceae bacterium]